MAREWFREFFDEFYYATYRPLESEERNRREAEFIAWALRLPPGSRLLDLGCGYCRHAVYLALMGYRVTCLDLSEYLLERCRERAEEFGVELEIARGDLRGLEYEGAFDGVYMFYTTFGYFDHETNLRVLERISRALRPGGRLLLDIWSKPRTLWMHYNSRGEVRNWYEAGGYLVLDVSRYDVLEDAVIAERTIASNRGILAKREFRVRVYTLAELKRMLEEAGLRLSRAYGDYNGSEYEISSPRLIAIAEKPL